MGNHYIPQYYLKGFSQNDGKQIWVYDKNIGIKFQTQIKSTANISGLYSNEIEQYLANEIEEPANAVLMKIRNQNQINNEDKKILSEYMVTMMKRVPTGKRRFEELAPSICKNLFNELDISLSKIAINSPEKIDLINTRKNEIGGILTKFSNNFPDEAWFHNIPPMKSPKIVEALKNMVWYFLVVESGFDFLTSDNPFFFFKSLGIGNPNSEVIFPISNKIALWATWKERLHSVYYKIDTHTLKKINHLTVINATRFVFKANDEYWVKPFVMKRKSIS